MKVTNLLILIFMAACTSHDRPSDPINENLLDAYPDIYKCYEETVAYKEKQAGKVTVEFVIGGNGDVMESKVIESDFNEPHFHTCVLEKLTKVQFPPIINGGNINVTQPIPFKRKNHE